MDISFIESPMERVQQMRMIECLGSTRVFGGSLGRMILLQFVFWVSFLSFIPPFSDLDLGSGQEVESDLEYMV